MNVRKLTHSTTHIVKNVSKTRIASVNYGCRNRTEKTKDLEVRYHADPRLLRVDNDACLLENVDQINVYLFASDLYVSACLLLTKLSKEYKKNNLEGKITIDKGKVSFNNLRVSIVLVFVTFIKKYLYRDTIFYLAVI